MGLFSKRTTPATTAPAPTTTRTSTSSRSSTGGLFSRKNKATIPVAPAQPARKSGFFSSLKGNKDPATIAAQNRVVQAEQSERDADRALYEARMRVADAQAGVTQLRADADAEAKAARRKQGDANDLGKRSKGLGRHNRRFF